MADSKINFVKAFGIKEFTELAVQRIEKTGYYKKPEVIQQKATEKDEFYTVSINLDRVVNA